MIIKMSPYSYCCLLLAAVFVEHAIADAGDDFSNNLFSDLAPLLALFGERVSMQFLSESVGWADCIIFAMAPLGIITAIVSAIRVGGPSWLKALVGRSRENMAAAEMELMSSTSKEACELWNGQDVVRCQGSAPIWEFIILLPQVPQVPSGKALRDMNDEEMKAIRRVKVMRLNEAGPNLFKTTAPKDAGLWNQFWFKTRDWICHDHLRKGKLMSRNPDDTEWGEDQQVASSTPSAQAVQDTINYEDTTGSSHLMDAPHDDNREIIILRNTEAAAPNITINRPKNVGRHQLYLVAVFGIVLQLGVLLFFGFITYFPSMRYPKDDEPVAGYACPFTIVGTVVLAFGMLLCSHVVDSMTRESRYEAAGGKTTQLIWLQQQTTVSDQLFKSVALFPPQTAKMITASSRIFAEGSTEDTSTQQRLVKRIETKAILGTGVSLIGFAIQFIGLRGMHWSASIAQLVAVAVMTGLRAWVRRGFTDELHSKDLSQSYELDWFALNLGNHNQIPWVNPRSHDWKGPGSAAMEDSWKIVTGKDDSQYEALESCREENETADQNPAVEDRFTSQGVMRIRVNLAQLTHWHGPAREEAICLTRAIEVVMNSLFGPRSPTGHDTDGPIIETQSRSFKWTLPVENGQAEHERIQLQLVFDKENMKWRAYADEVEAVLSLWLYSVRGLSDMQSRITDKDQTELSAKDAWLRAKGDRPKPGLRLLGPYTKDLHQDLVRWMPEEPFDIVTVHQTEIRSRDMDLDVDTSRIVGWGLRGGQSRSGQAEKGHWTISPIFNRQKNISLRPSLSNNGAQLGEASRLDGMFRDHIFAVESYDTFDKLYAKDLFSAFMWAVGKRLKVPIEGHSEIHPSKSLVEDDDAWKSIIPRSEGLSKLARDVQNTGLGSLQDAYLSIVPPLSINKKLPQVDHATVEVAHRKALEYMFVRQWTKAGDAYLWLLRSAETFDDSSYIDAKGSALLGQYLEILSDHHASGGFGHGGEGVVELMQDINKELMVVKPSLQADLNALQILHGRPRDPDRVYSDDTNLFQRMNVTKTHLWASGKGPRPSDAEMLPELEMPDIMDWRPLHYAVAMGRVEQLQVLLKYKADPDARDICGGAPLHCSVLRRNVAVTEELIKAKADTTLRDMNGRAPIHLVAIKRETERVQGRTENKVQRENEEKVQRKREKVLLLLRADAQLADNYGQTPLHLAALEGNVNLVQNLIHFSEGLLQSRDTRGRLPLHLAALGGSSRTMKLLFHQKSHQRLINSAVLQDWSYTPVHLAALGGSVAAVTSLRDQKADITAVSHNKVGIIHLAAHKMDEEGFAQCHFTPGDLNIRDVHGRTAIFWAVNGKNDAIVEYLIRAGVNVDDFDDFGTSLLHTAVEMRSLSITRLLVTEGASLNIINRLGNTPLHTAVKIGDSEISRMLISVSANVNIPNHLDYTPLHTAMKMGNLEILRRLVHARADVDIPNYWGDTPLHTAVKIGNPEIIETLGTSSDQKIIQDLKDETAFSTIAGKGSEEDAAIPGDSDADVAMPADWAGLLRKHDDLTHLMYHYRTGSHNDARQQSGRIPSLYAAVWGHVQTVRWLLDQGANVNPQGQEIKTPLHYASQWGSVKTVELLIQYHAKVNARDQSNKTPLLYAAQERNPGIMELLLQHGAHLNDLHAPYHDGENQLHIAARHNLRKLIEVLIDQNKHMIHGKDSLGWTPLHSAANAGSLQAIHLLIRAGADINAASATGAIFPFQFPGSSRILKSALAYREPRSFTASGNQSLISKT
ncbi:hypothetical protein G7054_g1965 [Neopestalotiopsis clavispora]|nr:hypothetical protein G7054_g1965 [Neopestalotiopsis clavispora]